MLIEIFLGIIAFMSIILAIVLAVISAQSKKAIQLIQTDVHKVTAEATRVLSSINDLIHNDVHPISQEIGQGINNLNALSANIRNKVNSVNFLFRPLNFLNSKLGSGSDPSHPCETVPQLFKWIASTVFLIKTTKEFVKHVK